MVRLFASGHTVRLSKREYAHFKRTLANSRIDFAAEAKKPKR